MLPNYDLNLYKVPGVTIESLNLRGGNANLTGVERGFKR